MGRVTEPREADEHHDPGRGLRDGRKEAVDVNPIREGADQVAHIVDAVDGCAVDAKSWGCGGERIGDGRQVFVSQS